MEVDIAARHAGVDEPGVTGKGLCLRYVRGNVVVHIVPEQRVNALGIPAPFALALEVEDVSLKRRTQRRPVFCKDLDVQTLLHEVRVVVDVYVPGLLLSLESEEIDAFLVILAHIVSDDYVVVGSLHDPTEPEIVVAVVVLDVRVHAVVVRIEPASIRTAASYISIGFVVLDLYAICTEIEDTVPGAVAATIGERVSFVNCIPANPGDDAVSPCVVDVIIGNIHLCPQIPGLYVPVLPDDNPATGGVVPDTDSANALDPIAGYAQIPKPRILQTLDMNMNAAAALARHLSIHVVDEAVVDVDVLEEPFRSIGEYIDAEQDALIVVCSICICDLKSVDLPERGMLEKKSGLVLSVCVDAWATALAVNVNANRFLFCAVTSGAEHTGQLGSSFEED